MPKREHEESSSQKDDDIATVREYIAAIRAKWMGSGPNIDEEAEEFTAYAVRMVVSAPRDVGIDVDDVSYSMFGDIADHQWDEEHTIRPSKETEAAMERLRLHVTFQPEQHFYDADGEYLESTTDDVPEAFVFGYNAPRPSDDDLADMPYPQ